MPHVCSCVYLCRGSDNNNKLISRTCKSEEVIVRRDGVSVDRNHTSSSEFVAWKMCGPWKVMRHNSTTEFFPRKKTIYQFRFKFLQSNSLPLIFPQNVIVSLLFTGHSIQALFSSDITGIRNAWAGSQIGITVNIVMDFKRDKNFTSLRYDFYRENWSSLNNRSMLCVQAASECMSVWGSCTRGTNGISSLLLRPGKEEILGGSKGHRNLPFFNHIGTAVEMQKLTQGISWCTICLF